MASFTFQISTGRLTNRAGDLVTDAAFAGHGAGLNNVAWQAVKGVGPLPVGTYKIGTIRDGGRLGPAAMPLSQLSGASNGRSGFWIHGASATHRALSSDGCLILERSVRLRVDAESNPERILEVIA